MEFLKNEVIHILFQRGQADVDDNKFTNNNNNNNNNSNDNKKKNSDWKNFI